MKSLTFNSQEKFNSIQMSLLTLFRLLWPTESSKNNIYISFPSFFFDKFTIHLRLFFFFFPRFHRHFGPLPPYYDLWYFLVVFYIPIFRCTVRFLLRSQLSSPYLFSRWFIVPFACSCSFSGPQFLCIPTVCGRRIDRCCRRGIVDTDPFHFVAVGGPRLPGSESGYCHLLFPWHSFRILLSVDGRLLSFISLFPFFHIRSLFLKSSSVSHFFRSSGEDVQWLIYPRLALLSLPGRLFHYLVFLRDWGPIGR
jgi:hypothetical protein